MRNISIRLLCMLIMIFLVPSLLVPVMVSAQLDDTFAVIEIDTDNPFTLEAVTVVKDDFYHRGYLFSNQFGSTEYYLLFEDPDGIPLLYVPLLEYGNVIDYLDVRDADILKIVKDEKTYLEQKISFCDYDRVCEPCTSAGCTSAENSLTCPDCPSGSADNYCDLMNDSVCDPDCDGDDLDCADCAPYCFYDGMPTPVFCESDMGGDICEEDEVCTGDSFTVTTFDADGGKDCCVGDAECVSTEVDDVPSFVFSEDYAADILSDDEFLDLEEKIRAEEGIGFDESSLTGEEQDELHDEFYGMKIEDPLVMDEDEWSEVIADTESAPGYEEAPPSVIEQFTEALVEAKDAIPEDASPLLIVFLAGIVIITLALLVIFFTHKTHKQLGREALVPKVQQEIAQLLKRGYNYEQVRTMLLNKGYDVISVNSELTKYYQQTRFQYGKR